MISHDNGHHKNVEDAYMCVAACTIFSILIYPANGELLVSVGGLDSLMKGIVTSGYPDSNPKPPGKKTL